MINKVYLTLLCLFIIGWNTGTLYVIATIAKVQLLQYFVFLKFSNVWLTLFPDCGLITQNVGMLMCFNCDYLPRGIACSETVAHGRVIY